MNGDTAIGRASAQDVIDLAIWALDALLQPPLQGRSPGRGGALVPWTMVHDGRAILERAGIDWRALHAEVRS